MATTRQLSLPDLEDREDLPTVIDITPTNLAIANRIAFIWRHKISRTVMSDRNRADHTDLADYVISELTRLAIVADHCKRNHDRGTA